MSLPPGDRQQRLTAPTHCVVCLGAIAIAAYRLQPCLPPGLAIPHVPCVPMRKALAPV